MEIRPLSHEYLDSAVQLAVARQSLAREQQPLLSKRFEDAAAPRPLLEGLMNQADGVVAIEGDAVVGYLVGLLQATTAGRAISVPLMGHAAVFDVRGGEIYREMYASLSQVWIAHGFFDHYVDLLVCDQIAHDAWFSLGFGAEMVTAIRETVEVRSTERDIDVRRAGPEHARTIRELADSLFRYNSLSPLYRPYIATTTAEEETWEERERVRLQSDEVGYFLAYKGDVPIAVMLFTPMEAANEAISPEHCVHLWIAYLRPEGRADGIGTAVLAKCFEWARAQGYDYCTLRYFTANLIGARFWQAKGFRPLTCRVLRRIDERIAWARASE